MTAILNMLLTGLGRRVTYWGALAAAILFALSTLIRQGKHAAEADLAIRRAEARVRAMHISKETRHEVHTADRADLERRAERWMRD